MWGKSVMRGVVCDVGMSVRSSAGFVLVPDAKFVRSCRRLGRL
jgi:hypothetical protein